MLCIVEQLKKELKDALAGLSEEKSVATTQSHVIGSRDQTIIELNAELTNIQTAFAQRDNEATQLSQELAALRSQYESHLSATSTLDHTISTKSAALAALEQELKQIRVLFEEKEQHNVELQANLDAVNANWKTDKFNLEAISQSKSDIAEQLTQMSTRIEFLEFSLEKSESLRVDSEQRLTQVTTSESSLHEIIDRKEDELAATKAELKSVQEESESLASSLDTLKAEIADATHLLLDSNTELVSKTQYIAKLEHDVRAAKDTTAEHEQTIAVLQQEKRNVESAADEVTLQLEDVCIREQSFASRVQVLEAALEQLKLRYNELETEKIQRDIKLSNLEATLQSTKDEMWESSLSADDLQSKLHELESVVAKKQAEIDNAARENATLTDKLDEANNHLEHAVQQYEVNSEEVVRLVQVVEQLNEDKEVSSLAISQKPMQLTATNSM